MLDSGSTLKALNAYGAGLAQQFGQSYVGDLQNEVATGAGAANALAGQGEAYAGQVSANNTSAATANASAGLASANALTGVLGSALNAYGLSRGGTSFGAGGATPYNAFVPGG